MGRPARLQACDYARVEQALTTSRSLNAAVATLGVCRQALQRFVAAWPGLQARLVTRRGRLHLEQSVAHRPRILLAVDLVRATMAAAASMTAAARALRVSLWLLRRFAAEHGLRCLDGRRRR